MTDTNENFQVIKPGSEEWRDALHSVEQIKEIGDLEGSSAMRVKFDVETIPNAPYKIEVHYAAHKVRPDASKVVFLLKPISATHMSQIGARVYKAVNQLNIPGTFAEAGMSPLVRSQWDFVLFDVPPIRVEAVKSFILDKIITTFDA